MTWPVPQRLHPVSGDARETPAGVMRFVGLRNLLNGQEERANFEALGGGGHR